MANKPNNTDKQRTWFKLDNAAKIFPGQNSAKWSNIFRLSVTLDEKIDPVLLEKALEQTIVRFPFFDVRMRRGLFWYYLEKNKHTAPPVLPDIKNPCYRVRWHENKGFLFRVYYYENKISVDFFHSLTDGFGSSRFVCTLAAQYLRLTGVDIPTGAAVLDINEAASHAEMEDAFCRHGTSKGKPRKRGRFVYHAKGTKMPAHTLNITTGFLSVQDVVDKAKEYGATLTEFMAAMLLDVLYHKQLHENRIQKEISVQVPVNLRSAFPSETLRNFTMCYDVRIDPRLGEYSFEEILRQVSLYLRYINTPKELNAMMTANLKLERNWLLRAMPLGIKKIGIALSFIFTGERRTSILFTNLGIVDVPGEMRKHIQKFILMPGPGKINGTRIGAVSFMGTLALTFANIYRESNIEREFFTRFIKMGIPVKIESNKD